MINWIFKISDFRPPAIVSRLGEAGVDETGFMQSAWEKK